MTSPRTRSIADITKTLLQSCNERLWHYTVGFVRVEKSKSGVDAILLGSGVLVKVGDVHAILTADHVLQILPRSGRLGLILSTKTERTTIDVSEIEYISIDRGDDSERGPDIGAVLLFGPSTASLEARKSFYKLDLPKERLLSTLPDSREGIWFVQGFVDEMTVLDPDPSPYKRSKGFFQYGAAGGVEDYVLSGNHDYYTFPITATASEDIPSSFRGCSGGGLWQVLLVEKEGGELDINKILLQGLAFFQQLPHEGSSALICHGPRSIYDVVCTAIEQHTS